MEVESSLLCSKERTTYPCHEPISPGCTLLYDIFEIHFNFIKSMPWSFKWSVSCMFLTKMLYAFLFYLILATCPTHPIVCDLITGIIFAEVYRSSMQLVGMRVAVCVGGVWLLLNKHCD